MKNHDKPTPAPSPSANRIVKEDRSGAVLAGLVLGLAGLAVLGFMFFLVDGL